MFENEKSEDYMGMVSWSKVCCSIPQNLFGTEVKTTTPIRLRIHRAVENREINHNWYSPHNKIIEVEMSPIQWAEFLTSGNTNGVPCTIKEVERKRMSEPKANEMIKVYDREVDQHFNDIKEDFSEIAKLLDGLLSTGRMNKSNTENLATLINRVKNNMNSNMSYIKNCFKEDMDGVVTKAKAEFNAYVETRIHEIGIEAIKADSVKFLEDSEK